MFGVLKEQQNLHYGTSKDKGGGKVREITELGHIGPICHGKA